MPMQHGAADALVTCLGLGHTDAAFVHPEHALGHRLDGVPHGGRRLARAHRPVGHGADLEQERAAAGEERPGAVRAPGPHHRVQRFEQQQAAAPRVAELMDLAQQIGGLGQLSPRPGGDHVHAGIGERGRLAAQGDERSRLEGVPEARDGGVEGLHRGTVELPDDVVAPVQAPEHVVERIDTGADSLLGLRSLKHCCRRTQ